VLVEFSQELHVFEHFEKRCLLGSSGEEDGSVSAFDGVFLGRGLNHKLQGLTLLSGVDWIFLMSPTVKASNRELARFSFSRPALVAAWKDSGTAAWRGSSCSVPDWASASDTSPAFLVPFFFLFLEPFEKAL
jgi:hypothetical protein